MRIRLKKITVSLLIFGCSTLSFSAPVLVKSQHDIEEYQLENGLKIILAPSAKEDKIFMNTVYYTGSLNDPQGKGGLAHLLEHLAFKGTKTVSGDEFKRRLNQYTLMTNASTDYYSTKYINVIRADQNALNNVIQLEADRMDQLLLQEKYIPTEIDIVKREREIRLDQPFSVLMDQVWKELYGNQHLGRLPIGDLNELQSIGIQELNKFYRDWYAPNNAFVLISGKFDKQEVLKQIDQYFSPIQSRPVPTQAKVPALDPSKLKKRNFAVAKGSDLVKFNIYLNQPNENQKIALSAAPVLFTLAPSGHLYQNMVETGTATAVQSSSWLDQDFSIVFMGAVYAPNHQSLAVTQGLVKGVEQNKGFNATELKRIQQMSRNQADNIKNSASALGSRLTDYAVAYQGDWSRYFNDLDQLQKLNVEQVNSIYQNFFVPQNRVQGDIQPTPEDQKKALQAKAEEPQQTLDQQTVVEEPLKDIGFYQTEVEQFVAQSKQYLNSKEQKIQRDKLKNGIQYALYPTTTRDDKVYATIALDFGTAESLKNKAELLDLMSYLVLRASKDQSLQQISDKTIEVGGSANVSASLNGLNIQISAKKEYFEDYFKYIMSVLKNPIFEQSQFDLIKSQTLSSLNRSYTEPDTVVGLAFSRLVEQYQPGDLRYHFEPDFAVKQYQAATRDQVVALYKEFFETHHARVAITGEFHPKTMQKLIKNEFGNWKTKQPYARLSDAFSRYPAKKIHALSEQREFGSYSAAITMPVGSDNPDVPALQVFRHILGESQLSSRLAKELREKHALVYSFSADVQFGEFEDNGVLAIGANYTAGKSALVSQGVHKVLKELLEKGVTEQEVAAAKSSILKKRVSSLEDDRRIHSMLISQLEKNRTLNDRTKRDQALASLTKKDIDLVIQKYIHLDQLMEVMADQYGKPIQ